MSTPARIKVLLSSAVFLGICGVSQPGFSLGLVPYNISHSLMQNAPTTAQTPFGSISLSGNQIPQSMNVQWPTNSINLSQIQNLLTQNPGVGQFNLQFPNQTNWGITPATVQSLMGMLQQSADSTGYTGKLPDLNFSSLVSAAASANLPQLLINPKGDVQGQLTDMLRNMRYQSIDLGDSLPDWLKRIILAVYDFAYNLFQTAGNQLAGLITR